MKIINKKENKELIKEITIADFIEKNHKLLSVFAIFAALTIFSNNISVEWASSLLSVLFLTAMILIWFELLGTFPSMKPGTLSLAWFEDILSGIFLVIIIYWVIIINVTLPYILTIIIAMGVFYLFSAIIVKRFIRSFLEKKSKKFRYFFYIAILLLVYSLSFYLAILLTPFIRIFLEEIT